MNKKGFTLIELITTFALSSIIIVLLINIIIMLKNSYTKTDTKTDLLIGQGNLSNALNAKFIPDNLDTYVSCSTIDDYFCYDFTFFDGEVVRLEVINDKISFGNFVYKLGDGSTVENPEIAFESVTVSDISKNNSFLIINIPIKNKLYPDEDFGISLVYTYNLNS